MRGELNLYLLNYYLNASRIAGKLLLILFDNFVSLYAEKTRSLVLVERAFSLDFVTNVWQ